MKKVFIILGSDFTISYNSSRGVIDTTFQRKLPPKVEGAPSASSEQQEYRIENNAQKTTFNEFFHKLLGRNKDNKDNKGGSNG